MIRMVARLLRVLNSESDPSQISLAFVLAMVAGFTPLASLHNLVVFFLVLVLRVNLSGFILSFIFFSALSFALDPVFHHLGLALLTAGSLEGLWTTMYDSTLWRIERFNNSILMGSLVFSLAAALPLFIVSNLLIRKYRENILDYVRRSHVMQAFKATKLYRVYSSYSELRY